MDFQINSYWNVENTYQTLNGVASIMQSGDYTGLIQLAFLIMALIGFTLFMLTQRFDMFRWFFQAFFLITLFNMPIATVTLVDKTNIESPKIVSNVPWLLAAGAWAVNNSTGWIVEKYETVFNVPDGLGLAKGDLAFGHAILKQTNKVVIRDPGLRADLIQFFKECTIYDINDGAISAKQLVGGVDSWNTIFDNTNPARFVTYNTLDGNATTDTCEKVAKILKKRVNDGIQAAIQFYGKQMFPRAQSDVIAASLYTNAIGASYSWILQSNQNASDAIKQAMFNNMWREGGTELPALLNDPARAAEVSAMAGAAMAATQAKGSQSVVTKLSQETIPHLRNWLEVMLYSLFPVVLVMLILTKADNAFNVLASYFSGFFALGLIPIFFAIINHMSLLLLRKETNALELASGVPFQASDAFDATLTDEQTAIGYLIILAIPLAVWLATRMRGSMLTYGNQLISAFNSAGASAGAAAYAGNANIGDQSIDNKNINSTSMNTYSGDMSMVSGQFSSRTSDGTTRTLTQSGNVGYEKLENRIPDSIITSQSFSSGTSMTSSTGRNVESSNSDSFATGNGASFSTTHNNDQSGTRTQGIDIQRQTGVSGADNRGYSNNASLQKNWGNQEHYSEGTDQSTTFNYGGGGHVGMGVNGGGNSAGAVTGSGANDPRNGSPAGAGGTGGGNGGAGGTGQNAQKGKDVKHGANGRFRGVDVGGQLSANVFTNRSYASNKGNQDTISEDYGRQNGVNQNIDFNQYGSRNISDQSGRSTTQTQGIGQNASVNEHADKQSSKQASDSRSNSLNQNANRSAESSYTANENHLANPQFMANVAKANGMSAMAFSYLSWAQQREMAENYLSGNHSVSQEAKEMPSQYMDGSKTLDNNGLDQINKQNHQTLPKDISSYAESYQDRAGVNPGQIKPMQVNTDRPDIVNRAEGAVTEKSGAIRTQGGKIADQSEKTAGNPNMKLSNEERIRGDMINWLGLGGVFRNTIGQSEAKPTINMARAANYQRNGHELERAAQETGVPISLVNGIAGVESGFNPRSVSPTGATGFGQFTQGRWSDVVNASTHPELQAISNLKGAALYEKRNDPRLNALATAENIKMAYVKTQDAFERNGIKDAVTSADIYAFHNTGNAGMAVAARKGKLASSAVSNFAIEKNPILYKHGKQTTAQEYMDAVNAKLENAYQTSVFARNGGNTRI